MHYQCERFAHSWYVPMLRLITDFKCCICTYRKAGDRAIFPRIRYIPICCRTLYRVINVGVKLLMLLRCPVTSKNKMTRIFTPQSREFVWISSVTPSTIVSIVNSVVMSDMMNSVWYVFTLLMVAYLCSVLNHRRIWRSYCIFLTRYHDNFSKDPKGWSRRLFCSNLIQPTPSGFRSRLLESIRCSQNTQFYLSTHDWELFWTHNGRFCQTRSGTEKFCKELLSCLEMQIRAEKQRRRLQRRRPMTPASKSTLSNMTVNSHRLEKVIWKVGFSISIVRLRRSHYCTCFCDIARSPLEHQGHLLWEDYRRKSSTAARVPSKTNGGKTHMRNSWCS